MQPSAKVIVKGSKGQEYEVYPERPFCSCPDFLFRCLKEGCVCKHIERVRASLKENTS